MYYIYTDHLNTPRLITNNTVQAVWRWDQADPFGGNVPDENPSGLGTFTCNLRFPGQYADRETGMNYNYFRDYDPNTGRYIESDPIGLDGGLNTYVYVNGNPLSRIDPTGQGFEEVIIPAIAVGGGLYCYLKGIEKCEKLYPNHRDRMHPDFANFIQCTTGVTKVIALGIGLSSDAVGAAASATGEAVGKKLCDSCE